MRQRAAASDVVIVNHHLLCADAAVRKNAYGEVIPACNHAIVDEAHQLEDIATQYFGVGVSNYRIEDSRATSERFAAIGARRPTQSATDDRQGARQPARSRAGVLRASWRSRTAPTIALRGEERVARHRRVAVRHASEAAAYVAGALDVARSDAGARSEDARHRTRATSPTPARTPPPLARRAGEIRDELRFLLRAGDPEFVYFVEFRGKGVFLRASPIDVSAIVRELLFDRMRTTVLTSATLTVDGELRLHPRAGWASVAPTKCGCRRSSTSRQQAMLYLPPRMPDPRSPDFAMAAGRQVIEILKRIARPRVRAVHQLRDAARGPGDRGDGARLPDSRAGHGAAHAAARSSSARRRTACCSRRRASGRAWTSSATR